MSKQSFIKRILSLGRGEEGSGEAPETEALAATTLADSSLAGGGAMEATAGGEAALKPSITEILFRRRSGEEVAETETKDEARPVVPEHLAERRLSTREETAQTLAILARRLRGRTLGLFTSLARMRDAGDRLSQLLEGEGIEVLLPRRSGDDPGALVDRFRKAKGGAVLLGARRFWQGIDVRGDDLQAVVIEKLPFDVPTELRRRRDDRLRAAGEDPFSRASLGRMLLHLKQMSGRLIRSETDRGLVVIVDARHDRGYFRRLTDAFPEGIKIEVVAREELPRIADDLKLGA